jgi:hypothetical protein
LNVVNPAQSNGAASRALTRAGHGDQAGLTACMTPVIVRPVAASRPPARHCVYLEVGAGSPAHARSGCGPPKRPDQGPARGPLTRYFLFTGGALALFLVIFLVAEALSVAVLDDPTPWLGRGDAFDGAIGTALLIADVVLPVPSSLIMIAYGALFGIVGGASVSLVGRSAQTISLPRPLV